VEEKEEVYFASCAPPVMCKCGVEASYGLVPSGLGIGHFCGHMIDYDEV